MKSDATSLLTGDSLLVQLPHAATKRGSVEIIIKTRAFESPTVFETRVSSSTEQENMQGVLPEFVGAGRVFVPQAVVGGGLIRNVSHNAKTPNATCYCTTSALIVNRTVA